jgi:hypothetical protein
MFFLQILEVLGTLLIGIATCFGAWMAWKGWKKEMRGQTEYKLAIDLLAALYRFRDAIDSTRNPMIFSSEIFEVAYDNYEQSDEKKYFKGTARLYSERWNRVFDAQQSIYANLMLAEAVWGEEVKNLFQKLFAHGAKLRFAIEEHLQLIDPSNPQKDIEAMKENAKILLKRFENEDDDFDDELKELIAEIETFLNPKSKS